MKPEYVTVFQISRESIDWPFALIGLVPLLIGISIILGKRRFGWKQPGWLFPIFACGFGLLWLSTTSVSVRNLNSTAVAAFEKGDYQIVEGTVTDFVPMPWEGHQEECFNVQSQRFCYSDYVIAPGFRNTASHGGPIRAGLPVRIAYSGGAILRLEIPRDRVITPAQTTETLKLGREHFQSSLDSDPVVQRESIAFLMTMICWTLWWNLQWKRVMRMWVRPPNRPATQYLFRAFFALNLLGAIWQLVTQLHTHPLARQELIPTLEIAGLMSSFVAAMSLFGLWMGERRDRSATTKC